MLTPHELGIYLKGLAALVRPVEVHFSVGPQIERLRVQVGRAAAVHDKVRRSYWQMDGTGHHQDSEESIVYSF